VTLKIVAEYLKQTSNGMQLMPRKSALVTQEQIENAVLVLRGENVLLDTHLAKFYGVSTKALNQAVQRNRDRFPGDFMYHLTLQELTEWRSQIVTSNPSAKMGMRRAPFAFTERGVAMLSSVLRSKRAVQVNIEIMRAFVRVRRVLAVNAELARRLDEVEKHLGKHDDQFIEVIRVIRQLMEPPAQPPRRRIGFHAPKDASRDAKPPSGKAKRAMRNRTKRVTRSRGGGE
jgi:RNase P protein component